MILYSFFEQWLVEWHVREARSREKGTNPIVSIGDSVRQRWLRSKSPVSSTKTRVAPMACLFSSATDRTYWRRILIGSAMRLKLLLPSTRHKTEKYECGLARDELKLNWDGRRKTERTTYSRSDCPRAVHDQRLIDCALSLYQRRDQCRFPGSQSQSITCDLDSEGP